jgi:hypothetical protein
MAESTVIAHIELYGLGMHPLGTCSQVQKNTHDVVEEKLLIMLLPLGCVNVVVRNEVNPFIGECKDYTFTWVYNTFRVRSGLDRMFKK